MIDTHAHLDACSEPADVLVQRAKQNRVTRIVAIGSGIESCRAALGAAAANDGVWAALGVHPHQAADEDARRLDELRELLGAPRAVAVGETGLDFYRERAPRERQVALFRAHLALAAELRKPVVVHSRDADEETAAELADFAGGVVLHCFSSPGLLPAALERGYYVSFAGNVTYPRAGDLRAAAAEVPPERLLAETDSPYLAPQAARGRPNEPANVRHTFAVLADLRGVPVDELAAQVDANADACFSLS